MGYDVSLAAERKSNDVSEVATEAAGAPSAQAVPPKPAADEGYRTVGDFTSANPVMQARQVDVFYGDNHAIQKVNLDIGRNEVIALIGPSGCGKSTFIRCLNRMNDTIESARVTGDITLDGENIYARHMDVVMLRARVGMVFQKPNPFPKSVYDNVAYGPRIHGLARDRGELDEIVQTSLERAGLWTEVKDRLEEPGTGLSGGQQQRLCIARTIAVNPDVILMDEPCSALDPIATARIEDLVDELKQNYAIAIVTDIWIEAAGRASAAGTGHGLLRQLGKLELRGSRRLDDGRGRELCLQRHGGAPRARYIEPGRVYVARSRLGRSPASTADRRRRRGGTTLLGPGRISAARPSCAQSAVRSSSFSEVLARVFSSTFLTMTAQ